MRKLHKELGRRMSDSARMQAEQMMRDFDSIMIPLQLNLTSQGCIDKDVSPPPFRTPAALSDSSRSSPLAALSKST